MLLIMQRFGEAEAKQIIAYHRTMPEYKATPLRVLDQVMAMMMVVLMLMIEMMMLLLMMMMVVLMLMIKMTMLLLIILVQLAGRLGIGKLWVKDESYRFNLKAFKVKISCTNIVSSYLGLSLCLFSLKVFGVLAYLDFVFGFVCVQVAP